MKLKLIFASSALGLTVACGSLSSKESGETQFEGRWLVKSGVPVAGDAKVIKTSQGLKLHLQVFGLTPGEHGFHIHEKADCSAADFTSAGGHFNPHSGLHGDPAAATHHAGDLGNIVANDQGKVDVEIKLSEYNDWSDLKGHALVIHEKADDLRSQPAGNAGARVACLALTK